MISVLNVISKFVIYITGEIIRRRSCIKFSVRNRISGTEPFRMLKKAVTRASVFDRYKLFKVDDEPRLGRPLTSTDDRHVNKIEKSLLENRH